MCFMKTPKISTQNVTTPEPLADPADAPKVETVDFGGSAKKDTESASGVAGSKATGKGSLKISKPKAPVNTGVNRQ